MALLKFHRSQAENPLAAHAEDGSSAINLSNLIDNRTVLLNKLYDRAWLNGYLYRFL